MKTIAKYVATGMMGLLFLVGGCKLDDVPPPDTGGTTGGNTGTTKTSKNIIVNNITITFKKDMPGTFEFTNNAGTDVIANLATTGTALSIMNDNATNATLTNVTATGLTVNYSNIIQSSDDHLGSDVIQGYSSKDVYIIIPADKSVYGYDEFHAYLNNDGAIGAGQINITGNTSQITAGDIHSIFNSSAVVITKADIK